MNPLGNPHAENGPRPVEGWPSDDRAPAGAERCEVESDARRNAVSYYNETYHSEHFGGLLRDERYYNLLAQFWRYSLFDRTGLMPKAKYWIMGAGLDRCQPLCRTACVSTSVASPLRNCVSGVELQSTIQRTSRAGPSTTCCPLIR